MNKFWRTTLTALLFFNSLPSTVISAAKIPTQPQHSYLELPALQVTSLTVSAEQAEAGDALTIQLAIVNEFEAGHALILYKDPLYGYYETVTLSKNLATGLYEGIVEISEETNSGNWTIDSIYFQNEVGEMLASVYYNLEPGEHLADLSAGTYHVVEEEPILIQGESLWLSTTEARLGEDIHFTVFIENENDIKEAYIRYLDPQKLIEEKFYLHKNLSTGLYEGTFPITEATNAGEWILTNIVAEDIIGNFSYVSNQEVEPGEYAADLSFANIHVNEEASDVVGPSIDWKSLTVQPKEGTLGEVMTFSVKLHDPNGIQSAALEYHHAETGQAYVLKLIRNWNNVNDYYSDLKVREEMPAGEWQLYSIEATDKNYNKSYVFHHPDATEDIFANLSFGNFTVKKEKPLLTYTTHIQKLGWGGAVADGQQSGTTGQSLRLEGIKIDFPGAVQYRTHVQKNGWMDWVGNGELSGTEGMRRRMEAIEIMLTDELAEQYDIYYRVHVQKFGWMDWAKNGEPAGSVGYSYRMEAIEIQLVEKGSPAPGKVGRTFIERVY